MDVCPLRALAHGAQARRHRPARHVGAAIGRILLPRGHQRLCLRPAALLATRGPLVRRAHHSRRAVPHRRGADRPAGPAECDGRAGRPRGPARLLVRAGGRRRAGLRRPGLAPAAARRIGHRDRLLSRHPNHHHHHRNDGHGHHRHRGAHPNPDGAADRRPDHHHRLCNPADHHRLLGAARLCPMRRVPRVDKRPLRIRLRLALSRRLLLLHRLVLPRRRGQQRRPLVRRRLPARVRQVLGQRHRSRGLLVPDAVRHGDVPAHEHLLRHARVHALPGVRGDHQRALRGAEREQEVPGRALLQPIRVLSGRRRQQRPPMVRRRMPDRLRQVLRRRRPRLDAVPLPGRHPSSDVGGEQHHRAHGHGQDHHHQEGHDDKVHHDAEPNRDDLGRADIHHPEPKHKIPGQQGRPLRVRLRYAVPHGPVLLQRRVLRGRREDRRAGLVRAAELPSGLRQVLRRLATRATERVLRRTRRISRHLRDAKVQERPALLLDRHHAPCRPGLARQCSRHVQEPPLGDVDRAQRQPDLCQHDRSHDGRGLRAPHRALAPAVRLPRRRGAVPSRRTQGFRQHPGHRGSGPQRHRVLLHRPRRLRRARAALGHPRPLRLPRRARDLRLQGQARGHHLRRRTVHVHGRAHGRAGCQGRQSDVLRRRGQELSDRGLLPDARSDDPRGAPDRPAHLVARLHPLPARRGAHRGDGPHRKLGLRRHRSPAQVHAPALRRLGRPVGDHHGLPGVQPDHVGRDLGRLVRRRHQRPVRRHRRPAAHRRPAQHAEPGPGQPNRRGHHPQPRRPLRHRVQPDRAPDRPPPLARVPAHHGGVLPGRPGAVQGRRPARRRGRAARPARRPRARPQRDRAAPPAGQGAPRGAGGGGEGQTGGAVRGAGAPARGPAGADGGAEGGAGPAGAGSAGRGVLGGGGRGGRHGRRARRCRGRGRGASGAPPRARPRIPAARADAGAPALGRGAAGRAPRCRGAAARDQGEADEADLDGRGRGVGQRMNAQPVAQEPCL